MITRAAPAMTEAELCQEPEGLEQGQPEPRHDTKHLSPTSAEPVRTARVARAFRAFMESLELDLSDPHLQGTEWRVARAYEEMFSGLPREAEPVLRTFPNEEGYAAPLTMSGIPFYSLCAHHFLPFFGVAHIMYVPSHRLVGLSKLARVVEYLARRPQVQERLTEQVAELLDSRLEPSGLMVVLEARHLCMEMRGVHSTGMTQTSATRGILQDLIRQQDFLNRIRAGSPRGDRYAAL